MRKGIMITDNMKYIYDHNRNVYMEFTEESFIEYCKAHIDDNRTVFLYDDENDSYIGYPAHIALSIMQGNTSSEEFVNSIKQQLMMI